MQSERDECLLSLGSFSLVPFSLMLSICFLFVLFLSLFTKKAETQVEDSTHFKLGPLITEKMSTSNCNLDYYGLRDCCFGRPLYFTFLQLEINMDKADVVTIREGATF